MPESLRNYNQQDYSSYYSRRYSSYSNPQQNPQHLHAVQNPQIHRTRTVNQKKVARNNLIHRIISVSLMALIGFTILPIGFNKVTKNLWKTSPYPNIKADYEQILSPTRNYISNDWLLGSRLLTSVNTKHPQMASLKEVRELTNLEGQLKNLAAQYPSVHPSVYVWDYDGNYASLNSDEIFATASIIKLPVLVRLFKSIELGQLSLNDRMNLTEYYRTEGSGSLQFKAANSSYSIDTLARIMITESDNSATNMLMAKLGSMTDINTGIRDWGLQNTKVQTWLPDLGGTNKTTAEEMARILYNIDNPDFLSISSREKIFDYMGHVKNTRLLKAGLPSDAVLMHKTGDIGTMLGDAGIVFAPNGKKYIVVILANRPHNSPLGKEFIVKASSMIYNSVVNL